MDLNEHADSILGTMYRTAFLLLLAFPALHAEQGFTDLFKMCIRDRFYGTTFLGGSNWDGTLFKLSVGLSGATAPTFNWVPASFQVNSDNLIEAQVRAGRRRGRCLSRPRTERSQAT